MRSIRVDITGTTDGSGNATIRVPLDNLGEYQILKFALSASGPAEWAVIAGGSQLTFGRGRRVTLGPELLKPEDAWSTTVSVIGGPTNAAILGTATGIAGSEQEMVTRYQPSPNTIALDSLATEQLIDNFSQAPGVVTTSKLYPLPTGTQNVRVQLNGNNQNVTFVGFKVIGKATGINYILPSSGTATTGSFDEWFKPEPPDVAAGILFNLDSTSSANPIEVVITADLAMNYVVASLFGAGTSTGSPLLVENTTVAPWQAAKSNAPIVPTSVNAGATLALVSAVAGQTVYLHGYSFSQDAANAASQWQLQDSTGVVIATFFDVAARHVFGSGDFRGFPLPVGRGVQIANNGAAASFVGGFLSYTQQ